MLTVKNHGAESEWKNDPNNNPNGRGLGMNGVRPEDKWDNMPSVPDNAAIGHMHLSFEYHKTNLKVRVWQVSDLLLPPPQTSMIESIFVRSYFIPDTVKKTNRQTEDVRVEPVSKDPTQPAQNGIQHIFTPSSFRFDTPLLYMGVTQEIVKERSIQLEVCMTQKRTHRMFLMAMIHMPLRTAVRRPIREKYPLIPCMNYTIPNSMRVYSARDIIVEGSSARNQSRSRSNSSHSNPDSVVTARDVHLEGVEVDKHVRRFISVGLSDSDDEDDGVGSSIDIKSSLGKSVASSTATVDVVSSDDDDDDEILREVIGHRNEPPQSVAVNISDGENPKPKKKIIPNEVLVDKESDHDNNEDKLTPTDETVIKVEEDVKETVVDITKLQGDVVLELDSKEENSTKHESSNDSNQKEKESPSRKKKIIPPEFLIKSHDKSKESQDESKHNNTVEDNKADGNVDISCVYDDIHNDSKNNSNNSKAESLPQSSPKTPEIRIHESANEDGNEIKDDNDKTDQEDELSSELPPPRPRASSTSSSTQCSRPETPVWDFYDFSLEEAAAQLAGEGNADDPSAPKDEASKALGTLQESLLRLSRASATLDTCRVSGPVLPTVAMEDFEMDDDSEVVDNDNDTETENENENES